VNICDDEEVVGASVLRLEVLVWKCIGWNGMDEWGRRDC